MRKEFETPVIQIVWSVEWGGIRMMSVTLCELLNDLSWPILVPINAGRKLHGFPRKPEHRHPEHPVSS